MRRYRKIRAKMAEYDVDGAWLGRKLGLSPQSISGRMTNRTSWSLEEAYAVLELFHLPASDIGIYFPPQGIDPIEV